MINDPATQPNPNQLSSSPAAGSPPPSNPPDNLQAELDGAIAALTGKSIQPGTPPATPTPTPPAPPTSTPPPFAAQPPVPETPRPPLYKAETLPPKPPTPPASPVPEPVPKPIAPPPPIIKPSPTPTPSGNLQDMPLAFAGPPTTPPTPKPSVATPPPPPQAPLPPIKPSAQVPAPSGKGGGKKVLFAILAFFLLAGALFGAYAAYQSGLLGELLGQTPEVAEVSSGTCSSGPPTASVCYGRSYGSVYGDVSVGFNCGGSIGVVTQAGKYELVCNNTTNNLCSADCREKSGSGEGGNGGTGGLTWPPAGATCHGPGSTGTASGKCVLYLCENGCNSDGKCGDGEGYQAERQTDCAQAEAKINQAGWCGQVDTVDGNSVYCNTSPEYRESAISCKSDCSQTPKRERPSPSPSPSISPSPSPSPSLSPSPRPAVSCSNMVRGTDEPKLNDSVRFTCSATASNAPASSVLTYKFFHKVGGAATWTTVDAGTTNNKTITIDKAGTWTVECQACIQGTTTCSPRVSAGMGAAVN